MSFGDVLVMVLSAKADAPALAASELLQAKIDGSHVAVLAFLRRAVRQEAVLAADGAIWASYPGPSAEVQDASRREAMLLTRHIERFATRPTLRTIDISSGAEADCAGLLARTAGVTVMMRPFGIGEEPFRRAMFESALYESGRPLILVPPERRTKTLGQTVLIAGDGSREAARAMADARPILEKAETIYVFSIDVGTREGPSGMEAGAHLRRTGLRCHQRAVLGQRHEVEGLLLKECAALGVDMLVMGGYGHARLHEFLFGGVTRSLVRSSPVPLFISR